MAKKKNKKSDNQKALTTALLIKALLETLKLLFDWLSQYIE